MLKYLIIMLDDTSVSFCHYENPRAERRLIGLDALREALVWAMKENVNVQFLYPSYPLPAPYLEAIDTVDHADIRPDGAGVVVEAEGQRAQVVRLAKTDLPTAAERLKPLLTDNRRVNLVLTDIEQYTDADFEAYKTLLASLTDHLAAQYRAGQEPQLNVLTDRLVLTAMNNCGAGHEALTLAPDGRFYVCPAFYLYGKDSCGSPSEGITLPNAQLYRLDHAPICRTCDAYQCHRCPWLNLLTTHEVNTPSREQCVVAHLERNATRALQQTLHLTERPIAECAVLDPFELIRR